MIISSYEGSAGVGNFSLDLGQLLNFLPFEVAHTFLNDSAGTSGVNPDTIGWPNPSSTPVNDVSALFVGFADGIRPLPNPNLTAANTLIVSSAIALQIDILPITPSPIDPDSCKYWISNQTSDAGDDIEGTLAGIQLCYAEQTGDTDLIGGKVLGKAQNLNYSNLNMLRHRNLHSRRELDVGWNPISISGVSTQRRGSLQSQRSGQAHRIRPKFIAQYPSIPCIFRATGLLRFPFRQRLQ
jgi:hypothetical protein